MIKGITTHILAEFKHVNSPFMQRLVSRSHRLVVLNSDDFDRLFNERTNGPKANTSLGQDAKRLSEMCSDMIANGRLREGDIPDDYRALVLQLLKVHDAIAKAERNS